ncbi:MAG TPA: class I SAM-dependent methyltransferase [Bryobacteraceae bacterium]|nr:class I SAM-dependent methyltransferase [Bryobacteraceae bacterium]
MNKRHSDLTAWGLEHVKIGQNDTVLDVGCGGGRTVQRLAAMAGHGKVHGVDYATASVEASRKLNAAAIASGQVDIQQAPVSSLPFPDGAMDVVTAVETHYYWRSKPHAMREILRVLKPGGRLLIIAEAYRGRKFNLVFGMGMKLIGGAYLSPGEHRELFVEAGYTEAEVFLEPAKGWICATGKKQP